VEHTQRRIFFLIGLALALCVALKLDCARADEPNYEGKTIRVIVGSSAGGGTDTTGRMIARVLPKYLPGNPKSIVQNMPGAGGVIANNYFASEAKGDGLTLLVSPGSPIDSFMRGGSTIRFDPRTYKYIGGVARGGSLVMIRKDAQSRLTNKAAKPVVVGDTDGIRTWVAVTVWAAEYLGWNLRWIYGYPGGTEIALAVRQGEVEMYSTSTVTVIKDLVRDGVVDLICIQDDERRSDFPQVPTFTEILGSKRPTGVSWQAYMGWAGPAELDKFLTAPEGTPEPFVKTLRTAFGRAMKDPEVQKEGDKAFGEGWRSHPGERLETVIKQHVAIPKEAKEFLLKMRKKYGLPVAE
jgi:tripartite-type tricarboxylate transporter receptor subunit TctC